MIPWNKVSYENERSTCFPPLVGRRAMLLTERVT
jgi:hypothetical protein